MQTRLLVLAVVALTAFLAAWSVQTHFRSQRLARGQFIDQEHCGLVHEGMNQGEVEAVLGGPPGNFRTKAVVYARMTTGSAGYGTARTETWEADGGMIEVGFDDRGAVHGRLFYSGIVLPTPSLADRFRWLWQ
jgi:hypothetical protein